MNLSFGKYGFRRLGAAFLLAGIVFSLVFTQGTLGQTLQGQNKGDDVNWLDGNVMGWAELEYIPMRVYFAAGLAGSHTVTINFPHFSGKVFGFEDLSSFTAFTPNSVFTSPPALVIDPSGNWSYVFTASISDNNPAEVRFFARLASGAHLYGGSSLQLKGSAGNVQFHKPVAAAGAPDLALTIAGPATATEGGSIVYTLSYTNKSGLDAALGAQISHILAPELIVDPSSLSGNARLVGNTLFWDLTNVTAYTGGKFTFSATVSPSAFIGMVLTNYAQILSSENDLDMQDNSAVLLTSVICGGAASAILASPASVTVCPGESANFSVTATGPAGLTYQWRKDGIPIAGATDTSFAIAAVSSADVGSYDVLVTSPCDAVTSAAGVLSLRPGLPINLMSEHFEPDGAFVFSFGTSCGGTYFVEYSEDLITWKTSTQTVLGNGVAAQWRDAGQPATDSMPNTQTARFYRVVRVF